MKHSKAVSKEDEQKLWQSGVMGTSTPRSLQNAVGGKMFCHRGGKELLCELKFSQVARHRNPNRYEFAEHVSNTRNGSFKKFHVDNKVVSLFPCPEAGSQCPLHVLDLYISKLPLEASILDIFFLGLLEQTPVDSSAPWYIGSQPVGKNMLDTKLRCMCSFAGIEGDFKNHSLRATSATQMFDMGVPEKVILERTGHKSLGALCTYERINTGNTKLCLTF